MATRRVIRGVLANFLSTYVSRYSDYDGYWLFGMMVGDLEELYIDLLAPARCDLDGPLGVAVASARAKFEEQVAKGGLTRAQLVQAWLLIRRLPEVARSTVNDCPCAGHRVSFLAGAVLDDGRRYEREQVLFIAPHDPQVERRSARGEPPSRG
jgi:hypothetical protein